MAAAYGWGLLYCSILFYVVYLGVCNETTAPVDLSRAGQVLVEDLISFRG